MKEKIHVGFWGHAPGSVMAKLDPKNTYPMPEPRPGPWRGQRDFLAALTLVEQKAEVTYYKGSSFCRCCANRGNGSREYSKAQFVWPEGYRHYVEEHNVKPPQEFIDFIMEESLW